MQDRRKTKEQLLTELAALRQRITDLESLSSTPVSPPPAPFDVGAFNQTLVNALPEAITLSDLSGTIVFANPQTARLHGYEQAGALLGLNVFDLIAAADRERVAGQVRTALASGTAVDLEVDLLRPDGQSFSAQLTVTALRDTQGVPQAVIGITRDITAQKQAQATLQISEAQLRAVVDDQTEMICRYQPDGTLTFVNDVYCRTFGQTRGELIGRSFRPLIPPEDHAYVASQLADLSPATPAVTFEHRVILPDGEVYWQQWTNRALYDAQGRLLGFQSVGRDVTERKEIERELADTRTTLEVAINQSPIPMALLSAPEGVIQFVNPAMRQLLGREAEPNEVGLRLIEVERTWAILDERNNPLPPLQSPGFLALQGVTHVSNLPTRVRRRDGSVRTALTSAKPMFDAEGRQIAAFVVAVDVTEHEELEAALHASEQRLNMALAAAQAGVWEYDRAANRAVWSDSTYRLMGYEPGSVEVSVENWLAAVHPDDRLAAHSNLLRSIEEQRDLDMEFRIVWPDWSVHWMRVVGRVTYDRQGQPQSLIGLQLDITEPKRLAEALAVSQERYRLLAQNLPDTAVYLFDRDLRYTLVEGGLPPQLGFGRDQMLGRTVWDVLPRERAERLAPLYRAALNGVMQTDLASEYGGRHFSVSIVPVRNAQGQIVAGMVLSQDVTERKWAEDALLASEEKFRSVVEQAGEALILFDDEYRCMAVNAALERLTGVDREAWLGLTTWEVNLRFMPTDQRTPEAEARFRATAQAMLAGQAEYMGPLEVEVHRPDGTVRSVRLTNFLIQTRRGHILGSLLIDITDRKRVEEALRRREDDLNRAQAVAHLGSWVNELATLELTWSAETYRMFGVPPGTPVNYQMFIQCVHPVDRAGLEQAWATAQTQHVPFDFEHRIMVDGDIRWVRERAETEYSPGGAPLRGIGTVQDITEQKQAETALQLSEALLRAVVQDQTELICRYLPDGTLTFVNEAYCRTFGQTRDQLIGHSFMPLIPEADHAIVAAQSAQFSPAMPVVTYEHRVILPNDEVRWQQWTDRALYNAQGELVEFQAVGRDITERKRIEETLQTSEQRLRLALEAARAGAWDWDSRTNAAVWSDGNYRVLGYEPGSVEARYENWLRAVHPDDRDAASAQVAEAIAQRRVLDIEFRVVWPDGSVHWIRDVGQCQYDADGQLAGMLGLQIDITESKQLAQALNASEARYRTLIENQGEGVGVVDVDENFVLTNPAAENLFGATDGLVGRNLKEFVDDEQYALIRRETQVRQQGQKSIYELTIRRPDEQRRDLMVTAVPQFDQVGQYTGAFGVFRDITARKQAEEALRRLNFDLEQRVIERTMELETLNDALQDDIHQRQRIEDMLRRSEQRYRTLFESAGDAIFIVDLAGHVLEANHMACQQLRYTHAELLGMSITQFDGSPEAMSVEDRIRQLRHEGEQVFEAVHMRRDGTRLPVEIKAAIVEYGGGPAILATVRDVADRKRAEHELRRYADEQTALYNTALFLNAQLDVSVVLRRIAEHATQLLGVQAGGLYLYDQARDALMLAVALGFYADYLGLTLKPGEGLSGRAFQQRRLLRLDDYQTWEGQAPAFAHDYRIHAVIAAPLLGKLAPLGVLFVVSDQYKQQFDDHDAQLVELLTAQAAVALENAQLYEQQQTQYRRLQDAQARLIQSEKMSALGRLIASISHEINNPLQAVQGCLALVREGIDEAPALDPLLAADWRQDLTVATGEVQRIAGIVQRLRDFYRPARPGWQAVEVYGALDSVLALTAKQLQHSRIMIEQVRLTPPPLIVTSNADQLKQVMLNLVLNAIDAMPDGGRLRVTTGLDEAHSPGRVRMDFTDNGQGIAPENLARIFEPFFTTKDTGSGLGLSISYELIEALGGNITVTSEVGKGSTFSLYLPLNGPQGREGSA